MLKWITGIDIKWVAIGMASIATLLVFWKLYAIVVENGIKDGIIATQKATIQSQNETINNMEIVIHLNNVIIKERDSRLQELETLMDGVTTNLGTGSEDLAPESLRELLRRIK